MSRPAVTLFSGFGGWGLGGQTLAHFVKEVSKTKSVLKSFSLQKNILKAKLFKRKNEIIKEN